MTTIWKPATEKPPEYVTCWVIIRRGSYLVVREPEQGQRDFYGSTIGYWNGEAWYDLHGDRIEILRDWQPEADVVTHWQTLDDPAPPKGITWGWQP